jgi:DNA-binding HxlR family transcriptional regulator
MNVTMNDDYPDPVETALNIIGGKYKPLIIWYLQNETLRYSELKNKLVKISPRMLSKQLKELEQEQIIIRSVYPQVPVKVEYSLSELGTRCIPILEALYFWGCEYLMEKGYNIPKKNK